MPIVFNSRNTSLLDDLVNNYFHKDLATIFLQADIESAKILGEFDLLDFTISALRKSIALHRYGG